MTMSGGGTEVIRPPREAIVVLGMHRSGTSAMARALSLAGAELPSSLMEEGPANPTGHWEPQDAANFNDEIFEALDSSWDDAFGPRELRTRDRDTGKYVEKARLILRENYGDKNFIVIKYPRFSIFPEIWAKALKAEGFRYSFVIMVRHPLEVADSLKTRNDFVSNRSFLLWATYMLSSEMGTRNEKRVFVNFNDLIEEPEGVLDRIESSLALKLPRRTWDSAAEIESFLKPELKHHSAKPNSKRLKPFPIVDRFYSYLESSGRGEAWNSDISKEVAAWLADLEGVAGPIIKQVERERRAAEIEKHNAGAALRDLESAFDSVRSDHATQEADLHRQLGEANAGMLEARQDVIQSRDERDAHLDRIQALSLEVAQRSEDLAEMQRELSQYREEREAHRGRVQALSLEAAQRSEDLAAVQRDLVQYRDEHRAHLERIQALSLEVARQTEALAASERDLIQHRDERDAHLKRIQALSLEVTRRSEEMTALESEVTEYRNESEAHLKRMQAVSLEFTQKSVDYAVSLDASTRRTAELEAEIRALRDAGARAMQEQEQRTAELTSALDREADRARDAMRERADLSGQVETTAAQARAAKDQAAELARELVDLVSARSRQRKRSVMGMQMDVIKRLFGLS